MDVSHTCGRASWVLRTSESSLDLNQAEQEPKKAKNVVLALFYPYQSQLTPVITKINKMVILHFPGGQIF